MKLIVPPELESIASAILASAIRQQCACQGDLGYGGPNDAATHTPERCFETFPLAGGRILRNQINGCRCLLPTCRQCSTRPGIDGERATSMLILDAARTAERESRQRPPACRHYSPDRLIGGILRIR